MIEFEEFPKLSRLSREMIITEKLDGTNAQIIITPEGEIGAGSRTRLITPEDDNFGFARWVYERKDDLIKGLGPGRHFGEWWGHGIQRGYGLKEKRFSLFNVTRWNTPFISGLLPEGVHVVPELWRGVFSTAQIDECLAQLASHGSVAAPSFMKPEGVVIYHVPSNTLFKKTLDKNDGHKGM